MSSHRHSRIALPVAFLVLTILICFTTGPIPAAHAGTMPKISAFGGAGSLEIIGTGFTPNGRVQILVRLYKTKNKKWHFEYNTYVKALGPHGKDFGGEINWSVAAAEGTTQVFAYDLVSGARSNTATTYVRTIM
jgi:hypothetical protein